MIGYKDKGVRQTTYPRFHHSPQTFTIREHHKVLSRTFFLPSLLLLNIVPFPKKVIQETHHHPRTLSHHLSLM